MVNSSGSDDHSRCWQFWIHAGLWILCSWHCTASREGTTTPTGKVWENPTAEVTLQLSGKIKFCQVEKAWTYLVYLRINSTPAKCSQGLLGNWEVQLGGGLTTNVWRALNKGRWTLSVQAIGSPFQRYYGGCRTKLWRILFWFKDITCSPLDDNILPSVPCSSTFD